MKRTPDTETRQDLPVQQPDMMNHDTVRTWLRLQDAETIGNIMQLCVEELRQRRVDAEAARATIDFDAVE